MAVAMAVAANTASQWPPRPQRCSNGGGPKFKLLHEGDIQVCRLNHSRTLISKVLSSKFLRRWEAHHVYLGDFQLYSATYAGFMDNPVAYQEIQDVYTVNRWDTGQHFCIRITIPDGSVLLRASNAYLRDQWLHSLKWKVNLQRYKKLLTKTDDPDAMTRELKELVLFSLTTPLQDDVIFTVPLKIVSEILGNNYQEACSDSAQEKIIVALAPVLEYVQPSPEVCSFFSKHCKGQSHFTDVMDMFEPAIHRILKHNMDFGKFPHLRMFVQDYIFTLYCKHESAKDVRDFVISMHSPGAACPHPRVLPNLVAVVLAAVYSTFDQPNVLIQVEDLDVRFLLCFMTVLDTCAQYEDWRPSLATLLQPIPFPKQALKHETFILYLSGVIRLFADDTRCEVHQSILPIRKGKDGWIDIFCPGGVSCFDEGHFFSLIMTRFLSCCGRRKKMLAELKETMMGPFMLLALRGDVAFIQTLTFMLEVDLLEDEDEKLQIVSTLESSEEGREVYEHLCQKREKFREMIEKGGPTILTLPTKSTDDDLARLLRSGTFGNVRSLNLAFTHVTSACAEQLVQLPALVHLNLWSTQFGDVGLQMVAEHLHNLESLNLCETPVTDAGLSSLIVMTSLRVLNLNSTKLSPAMFERLKKLPRLEDIDVRYTDV